MPDPTGVLFLVDGDMFISLPSLTMAVIVSIRVLPSFDTTLPALVPLYHLLGFDRVEVQALERHVCSLFFWQNSARGLTQSSDSDRNGPGVGFCHELGCARFWDNGKFRAAVQTVTQP
jgi:hypothetical protein